jgi:hypothetical protein
MSEDVIPLYLNIQLLANIVQGEVAARLGEFDGPDTQQMIKEARENAAQAQALMIVVDEKAAPEMPDPKRRGFAHLDNMKSPAGGVFTGAELRQIFETKYGPIDDAALAEARKVVNAGGGLEEQYPGVPGYGSILGKYMPPPLSDAALAVSIACRLINSLFSTSYATPRVGDRDRPHIRDMSLALISLAKSSNDDEKPGYLECALNGHSRSDGRFT